MRNGTEYLNHIAAKSDHGNQSKWLPFVVHAKDTANIIEKLFDSWLSESQRLYLTSELNVGLSVDDSNLRALEYCRFIALLHDIGKVTPVFQSKISKSIDDHRERFADLGICLDEFRDAKKSPHNIAGQAILLENKINKETAVIIGSHHGKSMYGAGDQIEFYPDNYYGPKRCDKEIWQSMWTEWLEYVLEETHFKSVENTPKPNIKCQMLLTGLLIMSDWIASNTEYFPMIDTELSELNDDELRRRLDSAWEKLGIPMDWYVEPVYDISDMYFQRFSFDKPNGIQNEMSEIVDICKSPGIYILEAPMGIGKTEAALGAAEILAGRYGFGGVYFGLPTQATANGIFKRICEWAKTFDDEQHTIRLAHGMTELNEEYKSLFHGTANDSEDETVIVHEWFEGRKQALLADFVIATVDQFLLASLKQKHVMLRHLGLAGKVVIIDECHAYDAYMNTYLDKTLTWMGAYNVPVILLSATLPKERKAKLLSAYLNKDLPDNLNSEYPSLTWTDEGEVHEKKIGGHIPSKTIRVERIDDSQIETVLRDKIKKGGCGAVIVNTVKYAQEISRRLKRVLTDCEIMCFHSRFIATDRSGIEKELLKRTGKHSTVRNRDRLIVVGTQVMEQSLDLDFDFMITELCPMDLLLQRSGRLHRHTRQRPCGLETPTLSVLVNDDRTKSIYSQWILDQTDKYLPNELDTPNCISKLVNLVYATPTEEEKNEKWEEYQRLIKDKETKAKNYCIPAHLIKGKHNKLDDILDDDKGSDIKAEASVRDGDETIEVIALRKISEDTYSFMPWENEDITLKTTHPISDEEAIKVMRSRIRLPVNFSKNYNFDKTIKSLDAMPMRWRDNHWLKGELLLLFDCDLKATVNDKNLIYSREYGLEVLNEEKEDNNGEGI